MKIDRSKNSFRFVFYLCLLTFSFGGEVVIAKEKNPVEEAFKSLYGESKKLVASSYLIEPKKPKDFYSPDKITDSKNNTAWVVNKNQGIGEFIYFRVLGEVFKVSEIKNTTLKQELEIINGYAENEKLFKANNRVKKVTLDIYEITWTFTRFEDLIILDKPILSASYEFEIKDTLVPQKYEFKLKTKRDPLSKKGDDIFFMAKLTIREIYPGDKHKDTCISEASVTLRK